MNLWQRVMVIVVFLITVTLWMTGPIHNVPTPVVSFIPITIFTMIGVIGSKDVRRLNGDVLLLLAGGLALGVAVEKTGLAEWIVTRIPVETLSPIIIALGLAYLCSILSNFMSNTATANILIPITLALGSVGEIQYAIPIALAASSAMCLPVSTPPNAIAFAKGGLNTRDFVAGGLLIGALAPGLSVLSDWLN